MAAHPPTTIELDQLSLRRPGVDDAALFAELVSANLAHLAPWMPWATAANATPEAQRARLEGVATAWEAGEEYQYLALHAETGTALGAFGLHRRIGPRAIELGYWLSSDAVGRGLATEGARALTAAALALDDVDRVEIHCDEANVRSQRVPQRLGYRLDRVEDDGITAPAEVGRSMVWVFPAT